MRLQCKPETCDKCQSSLRNGICPDCVAYHAGALLREIAKPSMWVVIARHVPGANEFVAAFADYQEAEKAALKLNQKTPWVFHDVLRSDVVDRELRLVGVN